MLERSMLYQGKYPHFNPVARLRVAPKFNQLKQDRFALCLIVAKLRIQRHARLGRKGRF